MSLKRPQGAPAVVLVGRPNVGKSTLFNRITGSRRAIVTPIAGTTRDVIQQPAEWLGTTFTLIDTGGMFGASEDPLHELVVQHGRRTLENADVIVFCGVHFMAETAKILNPNKVVILPDKDAGCSLEESCPGDKLKAFQATNPNFYTIAYINCSAEVKALSDVIVTSGNAMKIVNAAPKDKDLLFVPDENLGSWVIEKTGRPMTLWKGNCYVHVEWTHAAISKIRQQYPHAPLVAQYLIMGVTMIAVDLIVMAGYTGLASRVLRLLRTPRQQRVMNRSFAALFAAAAGLLTTVKRAAV